MLEVLLPALALRFSLGAVVGYSYSQDAGSGAVGSSQGAGCLVCSRCHGDYIEKKNV